MTSWQLYWLMRLDSIGCFFSVISIILILASVIVLIIATFNKSMAYGGNSDAIRALKYFQTFLKMIPFIIVTSLITIFVPSTKEMAAIIVIPRLYKSLTENKKLTEIPDKVFDLANSWLEELKPKKGEPK